MKPIGQTSLPNQVRSRVPCEAALKPPASAGLRWLLAAWLTLAMLGSLPAANIVWVSNNPNVTGFTLDPIAGTGDDQFITLLQSAGHNVIRFSSDDSQNVLLTQEYIDALNTNDLIIIGRSVGSAAFQAPQGNQWNTNITVPMLCQNAYVARGSRFGWFTGGDTVPDNSPIRLTATDYLDPTNAYLFGAAPMAGSIMATDYDISMGQGMSHCTNPPVEGAKVFATAPHTNGGTIYAIVEFPAGTAVKGGTDILAGYRIYCVSGNRERSGGSVAEAGSNNLTTAGQTIFLRAVNLALNNGVPPNLGEAPTITTQPVGASVCAGDTVSLSVVATGQDPLFYQWFLGANPVAGGTNATLTINNFQAANAGDYTVVVSNLVGTATSDPATVSILAPATVASPLSNISNACPGSLASFSTVASAGGPWTYTWTKNGVVISGETNNSLIIDPVTPDDAGTYCVIVQGVCNAVTNCATLSVVAPPLITAQPQSQSTPMGNGAVFTVGVNSAATPTYQWRTNGVDVVGATGSSLAISNLTLAQSGMTVSVQVDNCAGSATSATATLTVTPVGGISFDFDTPLQYTNTPYYMVYNDWLNNSFNTPVTVFESPVGGTGPFPGSGALDFIPNNGTDNTMILLPSLFDFSLPGKTLTASVMFKMKNPTSNSRHTQIGFITYTNVGLNDNNPQAFMSVILQTTAQPAPTVEMRTQRRVSTGGLQESTVTGTATLTVSNWYKLTATFTNIKDTLGNGYAIVGSLQDMGPLGTTPGATVLSFTTATNTSDIVNFRNVYLAVRGWDNTGNDFRDNIYAYSTAGPVFIVTPPASQTVLHGRRAIFRAYADGEGPYKYQWQRSDDGGTTWNDIPGARNWKYMLTATTADNGAQFRVKVDGPASTATSDPATLTVTPDELAVVGAGSVDGTTVGVEFNQPVDPVTASNPANYSINGSPAVAARVFKTGLGPLGLDGIYVILTPPTVLNADFTLVVSGVKDLSGNNIGAANSAAGHFANLTPTDINPTATAPAGEHYCFGPGKFIVMGGGADIWTERDQTHYLYTLKTGDFDVKTRVPYLDVVRSPTKAGFHVRQSLYAYDRVVSALLNPMWPGRNYPEGSRREFPNVASTSWGNTPTYGMAWYPNAWLRFRRVGNTFMRYTSTNGVNWQFDGQLSQIMPETLYYGLAVCSVANNNPAWAQFESYGDFAGYPGATIAITRQPTNFTVAAGSTFTDGLLATVTGGGIPASAGELAYLWQRNDGSGNWTNLLTAGATNNTVTIGPLYITDNGAQFRCVLRAPGAAEVISDVFTATVTDTAAPTITSVGVPEAGQMPSYPIAEVVVYFSEPMDAATALNTANYTVTNAYGAVLNVLSASFLSGNPRTVVLKVDGVLGTGRAGVGVSGVRDLNNNLLATTAGTFRTFEPPTAPVVIEVYQDVGTGTAITDLTGNALFTAGAPTFVVYSNFFGCNVKDAFGSIQDNYGVRAYTYFVPPTNGQYKFWIRSDDSMQLWMNTNGVAADPIPTSINSPAGQKAVQAVDNNPGTKYLNFDKINTGFTITLDAPAVVTGLRFTTANDAPERDPMTYRLEGTTGSPISGPWTLIAQGSTGMETDPGRTVTLPPITFPNGTAYTSYRIIFPTIRNFATANSMQIAEVEFLDAGGTDVVRYPNRVLIADRTGASNPYTVGSNPGTAITNITLQGGKAYYMEVLLKEGTGGDGFSVTWTAPTVNTAPATTSLIPTANLAFPASAAPATPVIMELYTGYQNFLAGYNQLLGLYQATNFPGLAAPHNNNFKYIAGAPDVLGYQYYMGAQPVNFTHTRYDNYLGRLMTYFIPPSNGLYRFYVGVDDVAQLWMNTNAVNSTDPAGKVLLGQSANAYVSTASQLVAQNVPLMGGQKYYMEVLWREGGGGDGVRVAFRSQGDLAVPPTTEVIPFTMLEYPAPLGRAGVVNFTHIASSHPQPPDASSTTVPEGQSLILSVAGLAGTYPYGGFVWKKNGVNVLNNSFTNFTPPLTLADDGSVYTVTVTNQFSSVTRSITVNVTADSTAPTVVRCTGWRYGDGFTVVFSEPVEAASATYLGNYQVSGGLGLLSAVLDQSRTQVSIRTTPQAPNTTYVVTINNVKDVSVAGNTIAPNTLTQFSTWVLGGNGYLVELWTNIPNSAIVDLTQQPKYVANLPDVVYYTNVFGIGAFGANSGLENYGGRISGYFVPTNTGLYRFYLRSDDASQFWMNVNGDDPAGRVMLIHVYGANITMQHPTAISPPVPLVEGQRYYIEALMKEGTGGDYLIATFRACDANGTSLTGVPADAVTELFSAAQFGSSVPGNPDLIQVVSTPPSELFVTELDVVTLALNANIPASVLPAASFQWQKFDGAGYTNIPGANARSLTFTARLEDDGAQFRLRANLPGFVQDYVTLLHVAPNTRPPEILSVNSLDGKSLAIRYKEAVKASSAIDPVNYDLNGQGYMDTIGQGTMVDDRTVYFVLAESSYLTTPTFNISGFSIDNAAATPVSGDVYGEGYVEFLTAMDIGNPGVDPLVAGSTFTVTNKTFTMKGGGSDVWGTFDAMQYAFRPVTGDFDVWVRVESFRSQATWSKAGIMVRGATNNNSRWMGMFVTPPADNVPAGQNRYAFQWRDQNAASAAWGAEPVVVPRYPNAWLRMKRTGSVITTYVSTNGVDWTWYATRDSAAYGLQGGPYPDTMLVGLMTGSGNNAGFGLAEFRDLHFPLPPVFDVQPGPSPQVVGLHDSVNFSGAVISGEGPFTYQWQKDGLNIPGANSATLTISDASVAHSGVYTLRVGNDGGVTTSAPLVLVVNNDPPVVVGETNTVPQNGVLNIPVGDLLANDSDPENDPLGIYVVSGMPPASFSANFNDGLVPAGSAVYGGAGGGYVAADGGVGNSGALKLTDTVNSQSGSIILDELHPGKRVSAFIASFKLRIVTGTPEGADGLSFNFANDLPIAASTPWAAENGAGSGISVCIDSYRFFPLAVGNAGNAPGGGTANTSGIKVQYNGIIIAGVQTPIWNADRYVPITIMLAPGGYLTVTVDGTNVFNNLALPGYVNKPGRFGIYARTGGANQAHWLDDLSVTQVTVDTARDYALGGSLYGTAYITPNGGVGDSGHLHLTDNVNNQAGSFILDELTPGVAVKSFTASFALRIGNGSGNAADGFSFNLAGDLPIPPPYAAYEEGVGTGLSLCVDNYPTGGADAPSFKLKLGGGLLGLVMIPKWNSPNWVPVNITLTDAGLLTVNVDGTNVVQDLAIPYTPIAGRFGFFARTGGENQTHWLDDVSITINTVLGYPAYYRQDFNRGGPGAVTMTGSTVTYTPPYNGCGTDKFYYVVTDGQLNGLTVGEKTVVIQDLAAQAPTIAACLPANVNLPVDDSCVALVPDFRNSVAADDNCCCLSVTQVPAPGTPVALGGSVLVTLTVTDTAGLTADCGTTVTAVDRTAPSLTCAPGGTITAVGGTAALPDVTVLAGGSDVCSPPVVITQSPLPGTLVPVGVTNIALTATDAAGNQTVCQVQVTVIPQIVIAPDGSGGLQLLWPSNMPPVIIQTTTNLNAPIVWTDLDPQPAPVLQPDGSYAVPLPPNTGEPERYYKVRVP